MMSKINVGICGYGIVGKRRFEYISKNKNYKIIGVCDKSIKKKYIKNRIIFYKSIYQLLKLDLDAIFICVTNNVAAKYTQMSLSKNLHVFCEKPPSMNVNQLINVGKILNTKMGKKLKINYVQSNSK